MEREKKPTKEPVSPKVPKKCKSHAFKEAFDQAREKKLATRKRFFS
jgi:hypothetical protein